MKYLLLVFMMCLSSCALNPFPKHPDYKEQYLIRVKGEPIPDSMKKIIVNFESLDRIDEEVSCIKFEVISHQPFQMKPIGVVPLKECHLVGGYKPEWLQAILNWIDDVYIWAEGRKHCFIN